MRKAQAATEYLIVLAVVIIIALIVIGVMGGIPGIGAGARGRASAAYWSTADIAIPSYANSATTGWSINVKNNIRNTVTITALTIDGDAPAVGVLPLTLAAGGTGSISITATPACTATQAFSSGVEITYTDSATGASYTFTGDGTKLEGTCAT